MVLIESVIVVANKNTDVAPSQALMEQTNILTFIKAPTNPQAISSVGVYEDAASKTR